MKNIYLLTFILIFQPILFAQSKVVLSEDEIRKSPYAKFENRSEKHATEAMKKMEEEIGKGLHSLIVESEKQISYKGFTLQRFKSTEKNKLGGDILTLEKKSTFGHINSIKRILNAYIQSSFEYDEKNADLLVLEVLFYNAENRSTLTHIKKRYTKELISALNKKKVGIAKRFSDWPGNTQIIIPIKPDLEIENNKISENNSTEEKETTVKDKNPTLEKETIKVTKAKIPSSDMVKEKDIVENKSTEEIEKSEKEELKVKEEKKNIEIRIHESNKEETDNPEDNNKNKSVKEISDKTDITDKAIENPKNNPLDTSKSSDVKDTPSNNTVENKNKKSIEEPVKAIEDKNSPKNTNISKEVPSPKETEKEVSKTDSKKNTTDKVLVPAKDLKEPKESVTKDLPKTDTLKDSKDVSKSIENKDNKPGKTNENIALNESKDPSLDKSDKPTAKDAKSNNPAKKEEVSGKDSAANLPVIKKVPEKKPTPKEEIIKLKEEIAVLKTKELDKIENSDNVVGEKIVFLKVKEFLAEGHYTSEMWALDTENDDVLFQSPFKKVCGKEFKELGTGVVVMSFKENDIIRTDTHHLALLDKETLKLIRQTNEVIFWRSFLKEQNGKIYAVEFKDGKYYLAQFKDDLTFEKRSSDPINPDCEIAFKKNKIYLTKRSPDNSGVSIRVLNRDNLKLRDLKDMK